MVISILFSIAIYFILSQELNRNYRRILQRTETLRSINLDLPKTLTPEPTILEESKENIILNLLYINIAILGISTAAGYFLAGRTLKPIQIMVEEQDRFITDASHELRTPLTALKSEIEVNLRDKNLTLKQAQQLLQSNLEEANHLQSLSDHLMQLTQYGKPVSSPQLIQSIALKEITQEAVKKVSQLAKDKNIIINNKIKSGTVQGDKQSLVELFIIFLDNAIKYSPTKTTVQLTAQRSDGHTIINIIDQGIGIDKKDLPHIFDRFYRADKSRTKTDSEGYGLGLAIAQQIVERYHGSIKVTSELGKGTTFAIHLPT